MAVPSASTDVVRNTTAALLGCLRHLAQDSNTVAGCSPDLGPRCSPSVSLAGSLVVDGAGAVTGEFLVNVLLPTVPEDVVELASRSGNVRGAQGFDEALDGVDRQGANLDL